MDLKFTLNTTERMSKLRIMILVIFTCLAPLTAFAQTYNPGDIAVINAIIDNNGLLWTKANPADGSYVPADWTGVVWSSSATDRHIIDLYISSQSPQLFGALDVSGLSNLQDLSCHSNSLSSLNASGLNNLEWIECSGNNLGSINISGLSNLTDFLCYDNNLTSLDLSGLSNLKQLSCGYNSLTSLDLLELTNLRYLFCYSNSLSSLDLSKCTNLEVLLCSVNNLTSLDLSGLSNLEQLSCGYNNLTSLDLPESIDFRTLYCSYNNLTSLDVSQLTNLTEFDCSYNNLTSLDVSRLTNMDEFFCSDNKLTELDVSQLTYLTEFNCSYNNLTFLDLTGLSALSYFEGDNQAVDLTMRGSGSNYTANVLFGAGATFGNSALSYAAGVLGSNSDAATASTFTSPTGLGGYSLSGTLNLTYDYQQLTRYNVSIGTFDNGQIGTEKYAYEEDETVILAFTPEQGYELASISAYKTDEPNVTVTLYNSDYIYTFSMPAYDVTVTAAFRKTQETLDTEAVEEAKAIIESASYSVAQAVANTEAEVQTWLVDTLNVLLGQPWDIRYEDIVMTAVTPAVAGTEANPAGTNGSFKFTVTLTIGAAVSTTSEIPGVITATAYTAGAGIDNPQVKGLEARVQNGTLYVSGLTAGKSWSVYNISGALVYQSTAVSSEENVSLIVRGVYLVKSDNKIIKVLF